MDIKIGDEVETPNGVGIVDDVRKTPDNEYIYLIRTYGHHSLAKGYSDIYSRGEFEKVQNK